jgi:hypothetical protein
MRVASLIPALLLATLSAPARSEPPTTGPSAATENNQANWADWDAQARVTDGDYDGAVQAEQQAHAAHRQADEIAARSKRHPAASPN